MGGNNIFTEVVKTLQGGEEYLSPALAFARKDIEKKTGVPLTARDIPQGAQVAPRSAASDKPTRGAPSEYLNNNPVGGGGAGGASGAASMVTVQSGKAEPTLSRKTLLGT